MSPAADHSPLVSIVIPTRDRAGLLPRALTSALGQTYPAIEVVVVDDGSVDGTAALLDEWKARHPQLVSLRNESPLGASAARNRGLRAATGEFVAMLDDDDEFAPIRIERLMALYRRQPASSFVCSDYLIAGTTGPRRSRKPGPISLEQMLWTNRASQSILTRRHWMLEIGGFDERFSAAQDHDAFTRLVAARGPACRLGEVLYTYHQDHLAPRISTRPAEARQGHAQYYRAHKCRMTRAQRAWHLYRLRRLRGKPAGLAWVLRMVPVRCVPMVIDDFLIEHTSVYRWLHRITHPFQARR
jgi:glycosyltransferase involved in cell wall biosynthesis